MHHLSPLAEDEIAALEADGISLTPHDIIHIAALGEQVMNPQTRQELARGRPVPVGGTCLWPLTLSASDWYDRVGSGLAINSARLDTESQQLSLAYAMAHGQAPLPEIASDAIEAIRTWRGTILHCTGKELETAIQIVQDQDTRQDTGEDAAGRGELVLALAALTNARPEVWEYQCSINFVVDLIETISAQCLADDKGIKEHRSTMALKALGLAVNRIRERHKRERGNNG
jgi:hypothetical protein